MHFYKTSTHAKIIQKILDYTLNMIDTTVIGLDGPWPWETRTSPKPTKIGKNNKMPYN
jgi:hypothetical protein